MKKIIIVAMLIMTSASIAHAQWCGPQRHYQYQRHYYPRARPIIRIHVGTGYGYGGYNRPYYNNGYNISHHTGYNYNTGYGTGYYGTYTHRQHHQRRPYCYR